MYVCLCVCVSVSFPRLTVPPPTRPPASLAQRGNTGTFLPAPLPFPRRTLSPGNEVLFDLQQQAEEAIEAAWSARQAKRDTAAACAPPASSAWRRVLIRIDHMRAKQKYTAWIEAVGAAGGRRPCCWHHRAGRSPFFRLDFPPCLCVYVYVCRLHSTMASWAG